MVSKCSWTHDGLSRRKKGIVTPWDRQVEGSDLNTVMKEFLKNLPQILSALPEIVKYIKYIPIIMLLAGIGFGIYYAVQNHKDPYICVNNHVFEQIRVDSDVYVFLGGTCVDAKDLK